MIESWQSRGRWPRWSRRSALLILLVLLGGRERAAAESALDSGVSYEVVVVDVKWDQSGIVSGTLVNRLNHSVREVRLLIRHEWLWDDEMSPGPDHLNPGRAVYYTVEGMIPEQGRMEFVHRPDSPLRGSGSGSFRTKVDVVGFVEVGD